ncbi:ABC transporter substrate-binding protein [Desertimonas flava]|uniref:ABC transporter substrate-binding protein n=1 Tax=Desertimonas flava TaxID=2064846 RepID=UPI0013C520ED|nr:ABC transporter substrate-binding protein [Desertimonas flava]
MTTRRTSWQKLAVAVTGGALAVGGGVARAAGGTDPLEPEGGAVAATGDPVKVGIINVEGGQTISAPDSRKTGEAAAQYANEYLGGIGGRPIELVPCLTLGTPESTISCANEMASNDELVAVALATESSSDLIVPIVTGAGIPYVTAVGPSRADLTTPGSFAITGGAVSNYGGMAKHAQDSGYEHVTMIAMNISGITVGIDEFAVPAFEGAGVELEVVYADPGTADMTPTVTSAVQNGSDAIAILGSDPFCAATLLAVEAVGATDLDIFGSGRCASEQVIDVAPPDVLEGMTIINFYYAGADEPVGQLYHDIVERYAPGTDGRGTNASGYVSVLGLVRATAGLEGEVTRETVMEALTTSNGILSPLTADETFSCDGSVVAAYPGACSAAYTVSTVDRDGIEHFVSTGDASDLFR